MSDTSTPGDRLDAALAELQTAFGEVRAAVEDRADQVGAAVSQKVDALSAKIDEVQAAWKERSA